MTAWFVSRRQSCLSPKHNARLVRSILGLRLRGFSAIAHSRTCSLPTCTSDVSELHQAVSAFVSSRTCDRNVAYRDGALVEAGCGSHGNVSFSTQTATTYIASLTEHLHLQLRITITSEGAVVQQGVAALPPAVERIRVLEERILHDRADRLRFRNLRHRKSSQERRSSAEAMIKVERH